MTPPNTRILALDLGKRRIGLAISDLLIVCDDFNLELARLRMRTGGSAGVDYLDTTALRYRVFRELWAVRTLLVRAQDLPPLQNAAAYGFAGGS